jgi:hypothetical protein
MAAVRHAPAANRWPPDLRGRFAYYPEGNLNPALYRNVYVGAQYFVMPSGGEVGEPCGISQQEAHAGGTPVVAHHQDGLQYTVTDGDFGDREFPTNGVKFCGFNGQALLDALLDAVEIYFSGQRRNYRDSHGRPKKMDYDEMVFNAFARDHRWIRPLRDYVAMYTHVLGARLPDHLDALRILEETAGVEDAEIGDVILRFGMTVPQAISGLIHLLGNIARPAQRRCAGAALRPRSAPDPAPSAGRGKESAIPVGLPMVDPTPCVRPSPSWAD